MIENWEGMEKWNDKRNFSFPLYYLIRRMKKQMNGKLIYLVEEKSEKIEQVNFNLHPFDLIAMRAIPNLNPSGRFI